LNYQSSTSTASTTRSSLPLLAMTLESQYFKCEENDDGEEEIEPIELTGENDIQPEVNIPSLPNPITPLGDSYSWHSPMPTDPGPYILGVDEAGRGPVLGPLVYAIAYCAESWEEQLEGMGFAGA
jgi:hypothetical protein